MVTETNFIRWRERKELEKLGAAMQHWSNTVIKPLIEQNHVVF